jgi:ketosteroid isomerase-like protein
MHRDKLEDTPKATTAESVVLALVDALNGKDIDGALALFSPDAVHRTANWPDEFIATGREEIRAWLAGMIARNTEVETALTQSDDQHVTGQDALQWDLSRRFGLAPIVGTSTITVQDGLITSFTWTATDESRARFERAVELAANTASNGS